VHSGTPSEIRAQLGEISGTKTELEKARTGSTTEFESAANISRDVFDSADGVDGCRGNESA